MTRGILYCRMARYFMVVSTVYQVKLSSVLFVVGMIGERLLTAHLTIGGSVTHALKQRHSIAGVADVKLLLNPGE